MFRSVLIANRGEIAVRIMRTCRRLGLRTVAVYSDADADALHVRSADEAIRIGPAPARDSYLDAAAIMAAAQAGGAEAIHPGYGFLSEKPVLPQLCAEAGLVFVGPSADRIETMGSKIGAKAVAARAGVPSVPGYAGDDQATARLVEEARRIGFPLMVKASAGGGGKGMRRVYDADGIVAALDLARMEAEAAFGDAALLIERLVARPRHLEVQVAGDRHGDVIHLFERDCSVQRNNQKVFEEAPAPHLPGVVREKLLARAVALAEAISYDNLGTVEFILEEGGDEPWFLEMNTRLQVEHPVTELVTGLDLVELQLRIAAGEPLPVGQDDVRVIGHAIEARIAAERADLDFRPDAGRVHKVRWPDDVRVDAGIDAGSEVGLFYDSLLAKAIAWGEDRDGARRRLVAALRDSVVIGPATTLGFLADAASHPVFAEGRATTGFLAEAFPDGWRPPRRHADLARALAACLVADAGGARHARSTATSPWQSLGGFRLLAPSGGEATTTVAVGGDGAPVRLLKVVHRGGARRRVDDGERALELAIHPRQGACEVTIDGRRLSAEVHLAGDDVWIALGGETWRFSAASQIDTVETGEGAKGHGDILAPMPGLVAEVRVAVGDAVEAGAIVLVMESMKLFVPLEAKIAGTVTEVSCLAGETVVAGKKLVAISPHAP